MREARSWRTLLDRVQTARQTGKTDPATQQTATQTEQRALGLLTEALTQTPPELTPQAPQPPPLDPIAEAEQYAQHHRKHAALIRKLRRLPRHINVGYIRPEVVHALINGTTPTLQALNEKPNRAPPRRGLTRLPVPRKDSTQSRQGKNHEDHEAKDLCASRAAPKPASFVTFVDLALPASC
jgi:hypothetical protein